MSPERVNPDNVVWFVADHERRLEHLEDRTEDMSLFRKELERCGKNIHDLRGELQQRLPTFASKEDVDSLRKALYTTALSVTGSVLVFAITMLFVYK
jgi:hypothetical protein